MMIVTQLILPIKSYQNYTADIWVTGPCNQEAFKWINSGDHWRSSKFSCLYGDKGSGKTHLALMWQSLWQNQSDALWFSGKSMDYDSPYDLIDESTKAVILDDADCIKDEEWLFHFYNALNERQISFLMTGRTPPTHWSVSLPDLKSRLATVSSIELKQPDEETLWAVFQKQLTEKGIRVSEIVIDFILNRIERSFADVTHWVTLLDQHSAQTKRPVTVALVKDLLGE